MRLLFRSTVVLALVWFPALVVMGAPRADHVFIISIDGGKPAVIAHSQMPVLQRLAAEGASTWQARTIYPSITLPSHTSMLTGVGPEKHHVFWNTYQPRRGVVSVPTIFAEAKRAGLSTAMFVGKKKFRHLLQPGTVDEFLFQPGTAAERPGAAPARNQTAKSGTVLARVVAHQAAAYIRDHRPNLAFIHFTDPDNAGHKYGWGSPEQIRALSDVDAALGEVVQAITDAGIRDQSVLIVTADHGGHAKTHGTRRPEDMTIPWIAWGKGVRPGITLTNPVITFDTAATALWLLSVPLPESFDGQPVFEAFDAADHQTAPGRRTVEHSPGF